MTHWTEAADLIGEREGEARGFVARYAPGALAFTLSAALGAYLVYLTAVAACARAAVARHRSREHPNRSFRRPRPDRSRALADVAGQARRAIPSAPWWCKGFGSSDRFAIAESSAPMPPEPPADLRAPRTKSRRCRRAGRALLAHQAPAPAPPTVARAEAAPDVAATPEPKPAPSPGIFEKLFGDIRRAAGQGARRYACLRGAAAGDRGRQFGAGGARRHGFAAAASAASCAGSTFQRRVRRPAFRRPRRRLRHLRPRGLSPRRHEARSAFGSRRRARRSELASTSGCAARRRRRPTR